MKNLKLTGVVVVILVVIGVALWWTSSEMKDGEGPLNKSDAFVYSEKGMLYWFEFTTYKSGKVVGKLHRKIVKEENGIEPFMEEREYSLTGTTTVKGYQFKGNINGKTKTFAAWFSGGNLFVQQQGTEDKILYKAVDKEELKRYEKGIQQELETAIYYSEEKEKSRIKTFFTELRSVYGYLYSTANSPYQLFIKIDEALLQGELRGYLLVITETGNKKNPYEETKYILNGITDGQMLQFYTTVDGRETKLKGHFFKDATGFDLSFWKSDQELPFHAITEEEYKQAIGKNY